MPATGDGLAHGLHPLMTRIVPAWNLTGAKRENELELAKMEGGGWRRRVLPAAAEEGWG